MWCRANSHTHANTHVRVRVCTRFQTRPQITRTHTPEHKRAQRTRYNSQSDKGPHKCVWPPFCGWQTLHCVCECVCASVYAHKCTIDKITLRFIVPFGLATRRPPLLHNNRIHRPHTHRAQSLHAISSTSCGLRSWSAPRQCLDHRISELA